MIMHPVRRRGEEERERQTERERERAAGRETEGLTD
jgi:hypothetical protein